MSQLFSVKLTAAELSLLDGRVRSEVQAEVDLAKATLRLADVSGLTEGQRKVVAEAVAEATKNGQLVYRQRSIVFCQMCSKSAGYAVYKSGRNKGRENRDKPRHMLGYELVHRFVSMQGYANVGGCAECMEAALPILCAELAGVCAELPEQLRGDRPPSKRYEGAKCTQCGWEGHVGEMRLLPAIMGGTYHGGCPKCPANNNPLGKIVIEHDRSRFVVEQAK